MVRKSVFLICVFALSFTAAGADSGDEEALLFGEGEMVITPARHSLTVSDAPASVTVITEEEIAASGAQTITDLLREVPGLEVFAVSATDVNVGARGYNSTVANKMLVMIDGRSVYEDFFGFVVWKTFPVGLHEIKQIEVVRGPGSAVYGANAYFGVIHIITKSAREMAGTSVLYRSGFESSQQEVSVTHAGRVRGETDYKGFAAWKQSGFLSGEPGAEENNPESFRGSFALARPVGSRSELTFSAGVDDGEGDLASGIGTFDYNDRILYANGGYDSPGIRARFYWNKEDHKTYNRSLFDDDGNPQRMDVHTNMWNLDLQWMRSHWGNAYWVFGGSARYHTFRSDMIADSQELGMAGIYGQMEKNIAGSNDLTVGLRMDHHPKTKENISPRVSLVHRFEGRKYVRFSVGEAYRSPTFIENYIYVEDVSVKAQDGSVLPLTADAVGHENLKTPRIRSYEVAYGLPIRSFAFLRLEAFRNENRDWTTFVPVDYYTEEEVGGLGLPGGVLPKTLSYVNLYDVTIDGAEASLRACWNRWEAVVGYSFVEYRNKEELPEDFHTLSSHKSTIRLSMKAGAGLRATLIGRYRSDAAFEGTTVNVPAHTTADGALRYDFHYDKVAAELAVQNIFDHRYSEYPGAEEIARRVYARLHYRF